MCLLVPLDTRPLAHLSMRIHFVARVSTDHISGIPNLCCRVDTLVVFSASERCSGSERHAINEVPVSKSLRLGTYERTLQIPQATVHSSLAADAWFA